MKQDIGLFVHPNTDFSNLYDSYRKCAELLLDQVLHNHQRSYESSLGGLLSIENSSLIYPLFFNYRQSVELQLKKALELSNSTAIRTHNLGNLYSSLLSITEKECDQKVYDELKEIKNALNLFHDRDKCGTGFRYEDENHEKICILRLKDSFNLIHRALNSVISNFGAIRDYENNV